MGIQRLAKTHPSAYEGARPTEWAHKRLDYAISKTFYKHRNHLATIHNKI